tara:strand:+ start:455 stop:1153 length:699 start_codon:yes stop_codon:yes gene_type:complete
MALPQLATAKYELRLPSTGETVEYRPFLVKEEKILLTAQGTGETIDVLRAVEQIIDNCTFNKLQVKGLPMFDLEYVFIKLRSKSIGALVEVNVTCPDDGETQTAVEINLEDIECIKEVGHTNNIKLTDQIGIIFDYPRIDSVQFNSTDGGEEAFNIMKSCVRQIYDADNVYEKGDMDDKELNDFLENMTHDQFELVQEFFNTMPKVKLPVKVKNPKTGVEGEVVLEGMNSFF